MTRALAIGLAALLLTSASALSQNLATIESRFAVNETSNRLAAELERRGIRVAARIDHAAAAKAAGLDMPPTELIMFGNPRLGTPLMVAQPSVAIELPMKMLVWQDGAGKVMIGYTPPAALAERYKIAGHDSVFTAMAGVLSGVAKVASGQ
jgi:uncharacterized protein (DUF302 family)